MPKLKSHSGAKKRVRATGSGKMAIKRHGRSHLLQQKSTRQKRLSRTLLVHPSSQNTVKHLLPHL